VRRALLPALIGLAACAHAVTRLDVPPPPVPSPEVLAALVARGADTGPPRAPTPGTNRVRAPSAGSPTSPPSPPNSLSDTAADAAFLDTLQSLSADSAFAARSEAARGAAGADKAPLMGERALAAVTAGPAVPAPTTWDIDIDRYTANERVQYYLDYFLGRAREHFAVYLARLGRYEALVRAKLEAARMPQDLVYLAVIESGMNPNAVSRRRAVGMWQFIASTARRYGLTVDPWVDERRDPWKATDAAIRMLSELNDRFGSLYLAAAAYDAGPGKIQRGLDRYDFGEMQGNDLYFALADERFLRRETRDYVPKLIAAAMIAKEPEKYGFDHIERWDPLRYDSIQVRNVVGLDVLARLADTTRDAMQELNPALVRQVTPPGRTLWVRVPRGTRDSVAARLAVLPPDRRITHVDHYVARGETLGANRGIRPRALRIGQRLIIPTSRARSASRAASARARAAQPDVRAAAALPPASATRLVHIVRPGENPYLIARRFQVPLSALLEVNGLTPESIIKPGQALRIPS
jgi:membrane-bound lytic murein transglycosylase D